MKIEDRLALNKYDVDQQSHIRLKEEVCSGCVHRVCLYVCPAECYKFKEEEGKMHFAYEGCLECGACRVACEKGGIEWDYPRGGFGVSFQFG